MCISTASFTISVNGKLEGFFTSNHGMQQGCSLYPYLYVIVNKVLSKLINKGHLKGGSDFICYIIKLSHLSFANDIIVFTDGTSNSLRGTLDVFDSFAKI